MMMLKKASEVVLKVVKAIADAVDKAFDAVGKFMVQLGEAYLSAGELVIDAIDQAFEKGDAKVAKWAHDFGGAVVLFAEEVTEQMKGAMEEVGLVIDVVDTIGKGVVAAAADAFINEVVGEEAYHHAAQTVYQQAIEYSY